MYRLLVFLVLGALYWAYRKLVPVELEPTAGKPWNRQLALQAFGIFIIGSLALFGILNAFVPENETTQQIGVIVWFCALLALPVWLKRRRKSG